MSPDDVRALWARLGLMQKALAATLGVATITVARWEQGVNAASALAGTSLTLLARRHGHSLAAAGRRLGRPSPRHS
jgi:DNA-binding transcriptional regulator YiaG